MSAWQKYELREIAECYDLHVAPHSNDGIGYITPTWTWSVAVGEALYARAYNGRVSRWYRAAVRQKAGRITAARKTKDVTFVPVEGPINDLVDNAYRQKYRSSRYLGAITGARARSATVKILPREAEK